MLKLKFVIIVTFLYFFLLFSNIHTASADIATGYDWIGLFPADVNFGNYSVLNYDLVDAINANSNPANSYVNTTDPIHPGQIYLKDINNTWLSGQVAATVPSKPGAYEFRMFINDHINAWYHTSDVTSPPSNYPAIGQTIWSRVPLTGSNTTCTSYPTASVALSWGTLVGVGYIDIYRDDGTGYGWLGKVTCAAGTCPQGCTDGIDPSCTGILPTPALNKTYSYYIQANAGNYDGSYDNSTMNPPYGPLVRTTDACNPTVTSLVVDNFDSTQVTPTPFTKALHTSGKIVSEIGANYLNPLAITLNAQAQGVATPTQYFVAFYDKTGGLANVNTLDTSGLTLAHVGDIQTRINSNPKNGFLLRYDTSGNYYVWRGGVWSLIQNLSPFKIQILVSGTPILDIYRGDGVGLFVPNSWKVQLYEAFGSKQMYTAVEVIDSVGRSSGLTPNIIPIP